MNQTTAANTLMKLTFQLQVSIHKIMSHRCFSFCSIQLHWYVETDANRSLTRTSFSVDLMSTRLWCSEAFIWPVHWLKQGWNWPWPLQREACLLPTLSLYLCHKNETLVFCQTKVRKKIFCLNSRCRPSYLSLFLYFKFTFWMLCLPLALTHSRNRIRLNSWLMSSIKAKTMNHLGTIRRG